MPTVEIVDDTLRVSPHGWGRLVAFGREIHVPVSAVAGAYVDHEIARDVAPRLVGIGLRVWIPAGGSRPTSGDLVVVGGSSGTCEWATTPCSSSTSTARSTGGSSYPSTTRPHWRSGSGSRRNAASIRPAAHGRCHLDQNENLW